MPDKKFWRKPGFLVSAGLVVVIVILATALVMNIFGGQQIAQPGPATANPVPETPAVPQTSTPAGATSDSFCGLPGLAMSGTVKTPPVVDWLYVGTIAAPRSTTAGPGKIDPDDYRNCFAHTPEGAVLAATNMTAVGSHHPLYDKYVNNSFVPGPGRDAMVKRDKATPATPSNARIELMGFQVMKYTGDDAVIDVVAQSHTYRVYQSLIVQLKWHAGDWKASVNSSGEFDYPPSRIYDLSGYVIWPPKG